MKIPSFQIRITLLSVLLSGLVLAAFGLSAWGLIYNLSLKRLDQEIKGQGHRHLSEPHERMHWGRLEQALQFIYGEQEETAFILLVKGRSGEILHISPAWPEELSPEEFPAPALDPGTKPPPPPPPPPEDLPELRKFPAEGPPPPPPPGEGPPPPPPMPLQRPEFFTWRTGAQRWRIGVLGNPDVTLVLGFNLAPFDAQMGQMRNAFLIALPAALLLIATGGWLLSQRALRPVRTLTETAERITAQRLDQRIPTEDEDVEFLRLVTVFNQMLDRLEKSFQQAVRFSADAAHELKTPLTILQGELEQALQSAPSGSDEQRVYNTLLEEVQRLKAIVRKLLLLSQADAGRLPLNQEPIPLSETLEALYEDTQILAPHLTVEKDLAPDLWVLADPDLLRQVLQNLTSNAIKYNRDGGVIRFHLRQSGPLVRFTLANTGEGIPPEDRDKIFDRFYRADKSRGRRVDGVGLGLSLAREIVRAHAGDLVLEDREDGLTAFTVTLPAAT